jgi:hypothetical protein
MQPAVKRIATTAANCRHPPEIQTCRTRLPEFGGASIRRAMTPEYLATRLMPYPLPTKDGWMLRTVGDIRSYMLALPKNRERRPHWERARMLLQEEAGVAAVTQQVHLALSKDDKFDISAFEEINGARRWRRAYMPEED